MSRELTYEVSRQRLARLSRSAGRKAYRGLWLARWILFAAYVVLLVGLLTFDQVLQSWLRSNGIPIDVGWLIFIAILLFFGLFIFMRRLQARQTRERADFDRKVRLKLDENGLHFMSESIDYHLKWNGISQIFIEPDGIVVSHANLFFFVPDTAFADASERLGFIREIYGRLGEKARAISEDYVRPALQEGG